MFRQKLWKYKNSAPRLPKKQQTLFDLPIGALMVSNGNYITSSGKFMAFNINLGGGGGVGVCTLDEIGRKDRTMPFVHAHKDFVSDLEFSPFNDCILATGSYSGEIKIWEIPDAGLTETLSTPVASVSPTIGDRRVEILSFNPAAENVLAFALHDMVEVADLTTGKVAHGISADCDKPIQSLKWKDDGSLLVATCKDGQMRVFDPRSDAVVAEWEGLDCNRESRCLWLGDTDHVLSAGFDANTRSRVVAAWDIRNCDDHLQYHKQDSSHGSLMPFYDADTNMLFICGKGDCFLTFYEVSTSTPYVKLVSRENIDQQTVGMATVPKRAMNLMECEVNRLLQMTKDRVVPISYIVPRKSYTDFHADVYPETPCGEPAMTSTEWLGGQNTKVKKIKLQPSAEHLKQSQKKPVASSAPVDTAPSKPEKAAEVKKPEPAAPAQLSKAAMETPAQDYRVSVQAKQKTVKTGKFVAARTSKYRYFTGTSCHKTLRLDNLKNLNGSMPGESDGVQAIQDMVAVPLAGPGGQVAVLQLSKPGRLPDGGIPVLQNGCAVLDFAMDPFDERSIAVACDDGHIRIWEVPENGLEETLSVPRIDLSGHQNRVSIVRYHPSAKGLLASAAHDCCVKLWNVEHEADVITLDEHSDLIMALCWHPDGHLLATACKDKKLRVFDPRASTSPILVGDGLEGTRGGRLTWAGRNSEFLLVSGFVQSSLRGIGLFNASDLSSVQVINMDSSPAIFTMIYDVDTNVILLTSRGDQVVRAFELQAEHADKPLYALSDYKAPDLHQALAVRQKNRCNIKEVEFLSGVRISRTYIEHVAFCVPRVKKHLFQDDVFPDTRVTWEPTLTCDNWLNGTDAPQAAVSLKPEGMECVTKTQKPTNVTKKYQSKTELTAAASAEEQKTKLIDSMIGNLDDNDVQTLPQDQMQGAEDHEWDD